MLILCISDVSPIQVYVGGLDCMRIELHGLQLHGRFEEFVDWRAAATYVHGGLEGLVD